MQAQRDPQVTAEAPVALQEAEQTLGRAERTWKADHNAEEAQHLAQLTEQRIEIARAVAQRRMAEADIQQLGRERERVLQEARAREARLAQEAAERAQQEAERAQREAARAQQDVRTATTRATQLEQELAALKAKETERGLVLTLGDVLFEFNRADLKPGTMQKLYPLVTFLQENPTRNVVIEGHTDNIGSDAYNQDLSERRAEAVRSFLIQNGIRAERVTAQGRGKSYPVASNDTEAGRQQNRRVEIVIPR
jgi:outer membrane protein OmpA-like peptidoglycan-associated protein